MFSFGAQCIHTAAELVRSDFSQASLEPEFGVYFTGLLMGIRLRLVFLFRSTLHFKLSFDIHIPLLEEALLDVLFFVPIIGYIGSSYEIFLLDFYHLNNTCKQM